MRSISARVLGRPASGVTTSGPAGWQRADPAALVSIGRRQPSGIFLLFHGGETGLLVRGVFRDGLERVAEHCRVVGADRTNIRTAPATGNDAGSAQNTLPEIEAILRANQILLPRNIRLGDDAGDVLAELGKAVRRAEAVAGGPIAGPMTDRIGRAGLEAASATWPVAQRGFHLLVARNIERTENCGEEDPRAVFRRQQLQIEAKRPETSFDRGMRQRQQRRLVLVRIAVVAPWIDMGRRYDDCGIAVVFEPVDKLKRSLFKTRKRQLVIVVFVAIVPGGDPRCAAAHTLR